MVPTIIISTVLVAIVGWVIYRLIRDARSGRGGCWAVVTRTPAPRQKSCQKNPVADALNNKEPFISKPDNLPDPLLNQ